jgi:hypothetical protein
VGIYKEGIARAHNSFRFGIAEIMTGVMISEAYSLQPAVHSSNLSAVG